MVDRKRTPTVLKRIGVVAALWTAYSLLALAYLWPVPRDLSHGRVLGHGGDEVTMVAFVEHVRSLAKRAPLSLLNPSLFVPEIGAPQGSIVWMPYIERVIALVTVPFASPEVTVALIMAVLYVLAGLAACALGQALGLGLLLSFVFGVAYAFTPFMYWRSFQHLALAGIFNIALMAWAAVVIVKNPTPKRAILVACVLLACAFSGHYLLLIAATLVPWIALFVFRHTSERSRRHRWYATAIVVPFLAFLLWMKTNPHLGQTSLRTEATTFDTPRAHDPGADWAVLVFSAQAIDYLSGNFDERVRDLNPARGWLNDVIRKRHRNDFYAHEHSVGIRWWVLVSFGCALLAVRRRRLGGDDRRWIILGLGIAAIGFFLSLSPRMIAPFGIGIGPSRWVHALVPEMRAPNRWGVATHLGVLITAFVYLGWQIRRWAVDRRWKKWRPEIIVPMLALVITLIEFPPTFQVPTQAAIARSGPLLTEANRCGRVVAVPYLAADRGETYRVITELSNSTCALVNGQQDPRVDLFLRERFKKSGRAARATANCLGVEGFWLTDKSAKDEWEALCDSSGLHVSPTSDRFCIRDGAERTDSQNRESRETRENRVSRANDWRTCIF